VLVWLSVWIKMQMICWCHYHPVISCFIKVQIGLTFLMPAYLCCPGKEAIEWVSVIAAINSHVCVLYSCQSLQELILTENLLTVSCVTWLINVGWVTFNFFTYLYYFDHLIAFDGSSTPVPMWQWYWQFNTGTHVTVVMVVQHRYPCDSGNGSSTPVPMWQWCW